MKHPLNPSGRRKRYHTLLLVFGVLLGFLISEAAFRLFAPEWLSQRMNGTDWGASQFGSDADWPIEMRDGMFVRFLPGRLFPLNYFEYKTTVHTDQWGGRAVPDEAYAAGKKRMVVPFLGDSFVFGVGVEDHETIVSLLSVKSPYHLLNLGAPGSALPFQLDLIKLRHRELGFPRVYLFGFFIGNDFHDIMRYYEQRDTKSHVSLLGQFYQRTLNHIFSNQWLNKMYVAEFIKMKFLYEKSWTKWRCAVRSPSGKDLRASGEIMMLQTSECSKLYEAYLDRAILDLRRLSDQFRFEPLVIAIPDKVQYDAALLRNKAEKRGYSPDDFDVNRPNAIINAHLRRYGIQSLDVLDCLRQEKGLYYEIDVHWRPSGHKVAAECVGPDLNAFLAANLEPG